MKQSFKTGLLSSLIAGTLSISIILGIFYILAYFTKLLGPIIEDEVMIWGVVSILAGLIGIFPSVRCLENDNSVCSLACCFILALLLGIMLINIIPTLFWLNGSALSDHPWAFQGVKIGVLPHTVVIVLVFLSIAKFFRR